MQVGTPRTHRRYLGRDAGTYGPIPSRRPLGIVGMPFNRTSVKVRCTEGQHVPEPSCVVAGRCMCWYRGATNRRAVKCKCGWFLTQGYHKMCSIETFGGVKKGWRGFASTDLLQHCGMQVGRHSPLLLLHAGPLLCWRLHIPWAGRQCCGNEWHRVCTPGHG
jgi:hypothetical protein